MYCMLVTLLCLGVLTPSSAAQPDTDFEPDLSAPIVGVNPVAPAGKYPAVAFLSIEYSDGNIGSCTGTLIDPVWVLTAAHCLVAVDTTGTSIVDATSATVILGSVDLIADLNANTLPPGVEIFETEAWITRGDYDPSRNTANDVALIRLPQPSTITPMPITTNAALMTPALGSSLPAVLVGYGVSTCFGSTCDTQDFLLHEGVSSIYPDSVAAAAFGNFIPTLERAHNFFLLPDIFTQGATCYGDSGGPVLAGTTTLYVIGVVSFGSDRVCDTPGAANGITDITSSELGVWVRQVIQAAPASCNGTTAIIVGTPSNDAIFGSPANDGLIGGGGNDYVDARAGHDSVCGGDGNDTITGNVGNDWLAGGRGSDTITGAAGSDTVLGNNGADVLVGAAGRDKLIGGKGNDAISGGKAGDRIKGGAGKDVIIGGAGPDRIWGQGGKDYLDGGSGNDKLWGGPKNDKLKGGSGKDTLDGGAGNDTIQGAGGKDELNGRAGKDKLNGGASLDKCITDGKDFVAKKCER